MNVFTTAVEEDLIIDESADAARKEMKPNGSRSEYAGRPRRCIEDNLCAHLSIERPESVGGRSYRFVRLFRELLGGRFHR